MQPEGTRYLFPSRIAQKGGQPIDKIMHNCAGFTPDQIMAECWTTGVKAGVAPETLVRRIGCASKQGKQVRVKFH
ncbi:MAG: hypothetical protein OEU26_14910 [Candidatus Tectomicrobia bacterium]|nr:hypothetical protein [Candidatus Tectomicrobia bacterium]